MKPLTMTVEQEASVRRIAKLLDANHESSDHLLLAEIDALKARLALAEAVCEALEDVLGNATCSCYEDGEPGHCPRCAVAYKAGADALLAWRAAK